jgi:putative sigma-54 modulation protein
VEVTPAIRAYVEGQAGTGVTRHFDQRDQLTSVSSCRWRSCSQKAEVTLARRAARTSIVDAVDADMYAAVDVVVDKLDRQVVKHKEKVSNHNNHDKRQQAE